MKERKVSRVERVKGIGNKIIGSDGYDPVELQNDDDGNKD